MFPNLIKIYLSLQHFYKLFFLAYIDFPFISSLLHFSYFSLNSVNGSSTVYIM